MYVLRIYFVFGDGDPGNENLQFLDSKIGSGLIINSETEVFNYTDDEKFFSQTEATTEFTLVQTTISEEAKNEMQTNKIDDDWEKIEDEKFTSTTSVYEIHTSEESKELEDSDGTFPGNLINSYY